ncbi:NACHT domain-containing protein [Nostocaceae cyanobacterium CENA369]|uniref:NACHT domain-containing protein n=1 Tax=Dendronalium phyllosphericum CENA369 TaxID=1725256 RepID=A0A8J7I6K2_9NOST|nr:NACHT domain-containing protein [Dendronalium phyllosphericum]MBH8577020.1 NACHT domain-containing protein [Dendronalium phyllosphericum CENA369]
MTGMEPLLIAGATSAVSGVAVPIFQSLWGGGGKLLGMFRQTIDENTKQLIFTASKEYVKNYDERHGTLKVLGMHEPVKLEAVYTAVQFLDNETICNFESIEKLEEFYRQANSRRFQSQDKGKQKGIKVANEKQYLMVLGGPGAGKSTFLRKMGLEALKGKKGGIKHACIPVFIELKRFTSSDNNIKKFIIEEFRNCKFPSPDKFTAKALEEGKLLILLDGLDEVPTQNLREAISQIQNFVDKYDKNRFIASCRTAALRSGFRRFSDVAMADFDDTQIQQFIYNWFQSEADKQAKTGDKCWELLQKPEHKAAKELAHTPLLLTFLCLVYDRSQSFPNNRSVLYRKALRILLEEWASEKRILRDEIYQGLHTELEEILLSEIAYNNFESDKLFFSQRDIVQQIKTFLASNLNAPQHLDGEKVLNAIAIQQGILVERAEDIFSFSHLTLQEYLTAQYIDDHRQIEKLVTEHLTDERWKEVFLLVAGLMRSGADELLLLMEKEAQKYINTPKLQALLNWVEQATTGSKGNFKPVGKRTVAIANANANANAYAIAYAIANVNLYAIAYAYAIANAEANAYAYAIAKAIEYIRQLEELKIFNNIDFTMLIDQLKQLQAKIPDEKQPKQVRQAFVESFQQTLLNAFNLTQEMVNISEEEAKALENYLYANDLIIRCKQAAVRVSPQTWETIEARMLLVPSN